MSWIRSVVAIIVIVFAAAKCARADKFEFFRLCRHTTGDHASPFTYGGVDTLGMAYVRVTDIVSIIPLQGNLCTLIGFRDGGKVAVIGGYKKIFCILRGGPECE